MRERVQPWNRLLREAVQSPPWEIFKSWPDRPQLMGANVGDTHGIKQEDGLNDLHRALSSNFSMIQ